MNRWLLRLRIFVARIWLRLLAFNILLVFLPLVLIFVSETYESQLRDRQETAMVQQGRLVAAALGEQGQLDPEDARDLLEKLQGRTQGARIRVIDRNGRGIADTAIHSPGIDSTDELERRTSVNATEELEQSWLYRLGALPFRVLNRFKPKPPIALGDDYEQRETFDGPEIERALAGSYGADTRATPGGQRSMTFYSAIPIRSDTQVVGAALVSQSTYYILRDLYEFRLAIFKVFLGTFGAAVVLSLFLSATIAKPLRRLRIQAANLLDARGRLRGRFEPSPRLDEIGDLERALGQLSRRLSEHQAFTESFVADISHEFKNPLASIRSATDVLEGIEDPADRERFVEMIQQDTARLERLLSSLREITTIDAGSGADETETVAIEQLTALIVEGWQARNADIHVQLEKQSSNVEVDTSPHRFAQVLTNLLDNAASFTQPQPASSQVPQIDVRVAIAGSNAIVQVTDHGPGIPPEHLDKVFDRFFSYRPTESSRKVEDQHSGLGLAIVKAIAESYGGSVEAENVPGAGARFSVILPLAARH